MGHRYKLTVWVTHEPSHPHDPVLDLDRLSTCSADAIEGAGATLLGVPTRLTVERTKVERLAR